MAGKSAGNGLDFHLNVTTPSPLLSPPSAPIMTKLNWSSFMKLVHILLLFQHANASNSRKLNTHPVTPALKYLRGGDATTSALSIGSKVIAGGASRALAQAILYPVDALRTLAQTRDGRTLADVGMQALVKGCAQTSSFALFTGAFQFGIFGIVNPHYGPLVASACGAAGSCLVSVPQEVIKQRLITGVYSSFREAATTIWRTEGILGFYSAWKPTVSRNVPFVITTFTCRDLMHKQLTMMRQRRNSFQDDMNKRSDLGTLDNLGIGIMSALVAGAITQPIDVIKTRMMTQAASKAVPYSSALDCALTVLRTEGWQKLYSGIGQRSVYMCGLWGLTFALEPMMTNYLNSRKLSF